MTDKKKAPDRSPPLPPLPDRVIDLEKDELKREALILLHELAEQPVNRSEPSDRKRR